MVYRSSQTAIELTSLSRVGVLDHFVDFAQNCCVRLRVKYDQFDSHVQYTNLEIFPRYKRIVFSFHDIFFGCIRFSFQHRFYLKECMQDSSLSGEVIFLYLIDLSDLSIMPGKPAEIKLSFHVLPYQWVRHKVALSGLSTSQLCERDFANQEALYMNG